MKRFLVFLSILLCITSTVVFAQAKGGKAGEPIKIGFTACMTGNFAQYGQDMLDGWTMYLDEIGYKVAGREIKIIVEDEQALPSVAIAKARKLIINDKVNLISGVFMANCAYAMADVVNQYNVPMVISLSAGDDLTQRLASDWVIRMARTSSEYGHTAADYAYNVLGWRKVATLGMDYSWGYETVGAFHRVFEELGGKVIQKMWTPTNTVDFAPFVSNFNPEADGIYECVTGATSIRFLQAVKESGRKWQVMAPGPATDESLLDALGDAGLGVYTTEGWSLVLDTPENLEFREKARKFRKGNEPTAFVMYSYRTAKATIAAIESIGGAVEDKAKLMDALRSVKIEDVAGGTFKLDEYGESIQNIYVRKVEKINGKYQNTVLHTYPNVSQFWNYDPKAYLKAPVYSRDYPVCQYCK